MDEQGFESINVIPFIDIMLVLLTIVLTTSTFIATGAIGVRLPQSNQAEAPLQTCLCIEIDRSGQLYLEGEKVEIQQLAVLLEARDRQLAILIRADSRLPLQNFVTVMDRVKQLGFSKVSLQTESAS